MAGGTFHPPAAGGKDSSGRPNGSGKAYGCTWATGTSTWCGGTGKWANNCENTSKTFGDKTTPVMTGGGILDASPVFGSQGPSAAGSALSTPAGPAAPPAPPPVIIR